MVVMVIVVVIVEMVVVVLCVCVCGAADRRVEHELFPELPARLGIAQLVRNGKVYLCGWAATTINPCEHTHVQTCTHIHAHITTEELWRVTHTHTHITTEGL